MNGENFHLGSIYIQNPGQITGQEVRHFFYTVKIVQKKKSIMMRQLEEIFTENIVKY